MGQTNTRWGLELITAREDDQDTPVKGRIYLPRDKLVALRGTLRKLPDAPLPIEGELYYLAQGLIHLRKGQEIEFYGRTTHQLRRLLDRFKIPYKTSNFHKYKK